LGSNLVGTPTGTKSNHNKYADESLKQEVFLTIPEVKHVVDHFVGERILIDASY
jgi:hypothetical protein